MNVKHMIGLRIRELRKKAGLSQERVAESADITAKHLSSIELGKENPTVETLLKLSLVFRVELGELLNYQHQAPRKDLEARIAAMLKTLSDDDLRRAFKLLRGLMY